MLAIARGLMRQPAIMMVDEPSLALAPKVVGEIAGIVEAPAGAKALNVLRASEG